MNHRHGFTIRLRRVLSVLGSLALWTGCGEAVDTGAGGAGGQGGATSSSSTGGNACGPDQDRCGSECVDLSSDPRHCAMCGNDCGPGGDCFLGHCEPGCSQADPACQVLAIEQTGIDAPGFDRAWRGQDISFDTPMTLLDVEVQAPSPMSFDEIRVMTDISNLATVAASTTLWGYDEGTSHWEVATFPEGVMLEAGKEYTIWFHMVMPMTTPGANLQAVNPAWGAHHTDTDPEGQPPGAYPEWNYEIGTNLRLYGVVVP